MTSLVLLVLAAIWAAVLLPPYLQKRRATHPQASVVDFHQQLAVLQRTGNALHGSPLHDGYVDADPYEGAAPVYATSSRPTPRTPIRPDVMRRRRDVFLTLVGSAAITFVLALALGGSVWLLHLVVDAMLLGYVALLLQIQQSQARGSLHRAPVAAYRAPARRAPARHAATVHPLERAQHSYTQQALLRRQAN